MASQKVLICPYCGELQPAEDACRICQGRFERAQRVSRQNEMGPWFIRDRRAPFRPGMSYELLAIEIQAGRIDRYSILRGPTTKQLWTVAKRIPGVSHLVGYCHECGQSVTASDHQCPHCQAPFGAYLDRNYLGLPDIQLADDDAPSVHQVARSRPANRGAAHGVPARSTGGSVSSFVSDVELVGGPLSDVEADQLRSSQQDSQEVDQALSEEPMARLSQEGRASGQLLETTASNVRLLSLQKQVRSQQRVVLMLVASLLIVVIAGGLGLIFGVLPALKQDATQAVTAPESRPSTSVSPAPSTEAVMVTDEDPESTSEQGEAEQVQDIADTQTQPVPLVDTEPVSETGDQQVDPAPDEVQVAEPWRSLIEQAQEQYVLSRDASLSIQQRLQHANAAAASLEQGPSDVPAPDSVRTLMKKIAEEIERLKLEDFLGS